MDMLQDYASDDDDDTAPAPAPAPVPAPAAPAASSSSVTPAPPVPAAATAPLPSLLPSAAELFDAPAARKRPQVNGSAHPAQHQPKVARSSASSSAPRTPPGATLVPPQLRGRSNVATEDLDKLFVQRQQRRSE